MNILHYGNILLHPYFFPTFSPKMGISGKTQKTANLLKVSGKFFRVVEVTGLEPATAWSQTRNATNCATPRFCGCKGTNFFRPLQIFPQLFLVLP